MEKEFVPYELALKLKELGFDEPCFGYYDNQRKEIDTICSDVCERLCKHDTHVKAPTFSQAFRWFREKYGLFHLVHRFEINSGTPEEFLGEISGKLTRKNDDIDIFSYHGIYEEAELACLDKLIEIIESKKE